MQPDALPPNTASPNKPIAEQAPPAPMPVNHALARNPEAYPLDVEWVDLFHDKGHLSRCNAAWMKKYIEQRLSQGERPVEIAGWCWSMALLGQEASHVNLSILFKLRPQSIGECFEQAESSKFLAGISEQFEKASTCWTPSQNMAYRGWGKIWPDETIQANSRMKYAMLSQAAQISASYGLLGIIKISALNVDKQFDTLCKDFPLFTPIKSRIAQSAIYYAFTTRTFFESPRDGDSVMPLEPELLAQMCLNLSVKNFRSVLASISHSPEHYSDVCGKALHEAMLEFDPDRSDAEYTRWMGHLRSARLLDSIAHLSNMHIGLLETAPERANIFLSACLGCPNMESVQYDTLKTFADKTIEASKNPSLAFTHFCLFARHVFEANGIAIENDPSFNAILWEGHLQGRCTGYSKKNNNILPRYADRHLVLDAYFPHGEMAKASLTAAGPEVAAAIEDLVLTRYIPAMGIDDSLCEGHDDPDSIITVPKAKRLRL